MFNRTNTNQLKEILLARRRIISTIAVAIFSYALMAVLTNISLLYSFATSSGLGTTLSLTYSLVTGFPNTVSTFNFFLVVLLSLLIGLNTAVLTYSLRLNGLGFNNAGSLFGSILAPTAGICSVCVTSIALAGFSISLAFFPFNGLELSIFAALLLIFSLFWTVDKGVNSTCKV